MSYVFRGYLVRYRREDVQWVGEYMDLEISRVMGWRFESQQYMRLFEGESVDRGFWSFRERVLMVKRIQKGETVGRVSCRVLRFLN